MLGRLRKTDEFERVRAAGIRRRGQLCTLNAALSANTNDPLTRVGYITSKKVGGAVQRNRARRLLREAMRHLAGQIAVGWDIVLIAHAPLAQPTIKLPRVQEDLKWLLKQASILTPNTDNPLSKFLPGEASSGGS